VCTAGHAVGAASALQASIKKMKQGERQVLVIGMGHGTCTCEGAAFEYTFNVEHEVRQAGVRDLAQIVYLTNEYELGDFGVGGLVFTQHGFQTTSKHWTESLFRERGIRPIAGAHVTDVEVRVVHYEQLDGSINSLEFDFAMLLPPFRGVALQTFDGASEDISDELFAPNGFMKVDADYSGKLFEDWSAEDWPRTYQVPRFPNIFAVGIAFTPPYQISRPRKSPDGTVITPSPPRTAMPSGIEGKLAATNIAEMIRHGISAEVRSASMADMGASCVASAGSGLRQGSAASMTTCPVVPDLVKYPDTGRSLKDTFGEIGLVPLCQPLDQAVAPLHLHLQGQGPPGLAPDPRVGMERTMDDTEANVASAPLPTAKMLRPCKHVIIQLERFAAINLKMARIIRRERH
jgi:sulfide:quinone oxidoreductase